MGYGDEIMVSGIANRMAQRDPHYRDPQYINRIAVFGVDFKQRWSEVWDNLDYMAKIGEPYDFSLINGPSRRPYYSGMEGSRIIWKKWDKAPGEIRLTDAEREWAIEQFAMGDQHPPFIVINPSYKLEGGGGRNKDWGGEKWQQVAHALDCLLIQFPPTWLSGALHINTPTFRHACAILERSIGYVGHEGGLHHAAAALGKPAVVVFGGYISPEVTGYDSHTNLYVPSAEYPLGCGNTKPCQHCKDAMSKITVEQVVSAVKEMVNG